MSGHTPGPWEVSILDDFDEGHIIRMGEAIESPYAYESHLVVEYGHDAEPGSEQYAEAEANARLIAAAPDLLEAMQAFDALHPFAGALDTDDFGGFEDHAVPEAREAYQKGLAAIAKATGGDS